MPIGASVRRFKKVGPKGDKNVRSRTFGPESKLPRYQSRTLTLSLFSPLVHWTLIPMRYLSCQGWVHHMVGPSFFHFAFLSEPAYWRVSWIFLM